MGKKDIPLGDARGEARSAGGGKLAANLLDGSTPSFRASGTAKFAPVHASREQVVATPQAQQERQQKTDRYCGLPFVGSPCWARTQLNFEPPLATLVTNFASKILPCSRFA